MQLDVITWLLLTLFIKVFADKRTVEQGSLVLLFENVTADNTEKEVTLYVSGVENPTRIVTFKFVNGHISVVWDLHMADNYINIFMDAKRNIFIANMDETYEKKFYIQSSKILGEVELTISSGLSETSSSQIMDALSETSYSTTERTPQKETTQKGDALSDKKTVEQGSLVILFENVDADNTEKEVNLYVNGVEYPTIIVTFKFENDGFIKPVWKTDNYSKIFMDAKRNIWIAHMDETYERKFYIYSSKILAEVELTILRNLTGEQIGESRKLVDDHTELIKEYLYLDGWNQLSLGLQIVTFIIVTKVLLMKLENGNLIRERLINMRDSRHMPENERQNQENESLMEVSGKLTVEQIMVIRKLLDDHTGRFMEYLGETLLKLPQPSKKDKVVPAADETNVKDLSSLRRKGGRIHDQS